MHGIAHTVNARDSAFKDELVNVSASGKVLSAHLRSDCHLHGRRYQGMTTNVHWSIAQENRERIAKLEHLADRRNMRGGAQRGQSPFLWCRCFLHEKTKKSEISFSAERASGHKSGH